MPGCELLASCEVFLPIANLTGVAVERHGDHRAVQPVDQMPRLHIPRIAAPLDQHHPFVGHLQTS